MKYTALIFTIGWLFGGCVSVNVGVQEKRKAANVVAVEPGEPFQKQERPDVDAAWKNRATGNVISYLSDCHDPADPSLDSVAQGVLQGVNELTFESKETTTFQGREARRIVASGKVDGIASKMDLLIFKRNQCLYIITYVGVESRFPANRADFARFLEGFRAP